MPLFDLQREGAMKVPSVTRIEFRMVVDGKEVAAIFIRPEKISDLLTEPCSLGEWLRALRDAPDIPDARDP